MFGLSTMRCATVAGAALAVLGLCPTGAAHADTFIPLPGGTITRTLGDGTVVHLSIEGESAKISGSMAATPLHRNVWTTGRAVADVETASGAKPTIKLAPGYVVGCQVNLSSLESDEEESAGVQLPSDSGNPLSALQAGLGDTETLVLGPGQATAHSVLDLEMPDDYGQESHKNYNKVSGPHASVAWTDETFAVNGCGGYAQARSFVTAEIGTGRALAVVTVWGAPFSMG
ncbi:MspA family porin [Nocardia veterana]|uniref:MspA family porin n=1 Tax=Nocardia veterana TaxID=132249 RepID=A0A7X6M2G8_9NOCA|nr:MspA family porin [Nocardia veterana]NKY89118.1 MspA family porin [Nocardia veterana]